MSAEELTELHALLHGALQEVATAATELRQASPGDLGADELDGVRRDLTRARAIVEHLSADQPCVSATTRWRQGQSLPHHVYRQLGDEPDTRPWPDGDPPVATFLNPDDARWAVEAAAIVAELARDGCCDQWDEPGDQACPEFQADPEQWCPVCRARALVAGPPAEYRHDECATCGTKADPVILQHPAGYTLAEQVQAVWDEEGPDGIADAIRRVARGEAT